MELNSHFWSGRKVFVTGHTGFKGAWLSAYLLKLGAKVTGFALAPSTSPNLFDLLGLRDRMHSVLGDINDPGALDEALRASEADIVLHLAAQALVLPSYVDPIGTFETNVMGSIRLLDAVRNCPSVGAVIVVTSDKAYENREQIWGYREDDPMGGHDPYSASKGAAEIVTRSMQRSFFRPYRADGHPARIATVRAGNVIGGGDWSHNRLIPDIVRGLLGEHALVDIRNPNAVRPWQHVLEPVAAYLMLAKRLFLSEPNLDEAWNIGPDATDTRAVGDVARAMLTALKSGQLRFPSASTPLHEANLLTLDCTKAKARLDWRPRLQFEECIAWTSQWYAAWARGDVMVDFTDRQIEVYASLS